MHVVKCFWRLFLLVSQCAVRLRLNMSCVCTADVSSSPLFLKELYAVCIVRCTFNCKYSVLSTLVDSAHIRRPCEMHI